MPLEQLVPYYRGAGFALVAMKFRHPDDKELAADVDRYVEMLDGYSKAAIETFRLHRQREAAGPTK